MSRLGSWRRFELAMLAVIVVLTLATAYIHYWVGGMMLMLNAGGYFGLVLLLIGAAAFYRRALPLILIALAAYAAVTIVGWLLIGPYFDVAYLAKGIEIVLIGTISVYLWQLRSELRDTISWGLSLPMTLYNRVRGRPTDGQPGPSMTTHGEE